MNHSMNPTPAEIQESLKRFVYNETQCSVDDLQLRAVCDAFIRKIDNEIPLFDYTQNVVAINPKGFELLKLLYCNSSIKFPSIIKFRLIDTNELNDYKLKVEPYPEDYHELQSIEYIDQSDDTPKSE